MKSQVNCHMIMLVRYSIINLAFLNSTPLNILCPCPFPYKRYIQVQVAKSERDDKGGDGSGAVGGIQFGNGKVKGTTLGPKTYAANGCSVFPEESPFCLHFTHHCSGLFFFPCLLLKIEQHCFIFPSLLFFHVTSIICYLLKKVQLFVRDRFQFLNPPVKMEKILSLY